MSAANGVLEDICAEIGFGATIRLAAVYGGRSLYVPKAFDVQHQLCVLLGESPYKALVREYGATSLNVPRIEEFDRWRRVREVSVMLAKGFTVSDIAGALCMTTRNVGELRRRCEEIGLVPMVNARGLGACTSLVQENFLDPGGPCK